MPILGSLDGSLFIASLDTLFHTPVKAVSCLGNYGPEAGLVSKGGKLTFAKRACHKIQYLPNKKYIY
jgi:hypothetical protein